MNLKNAEEMTEDPNTFPYGCDICKEFQKEKHGFLDLVSEDPRDYRHGETCTECARVVGKWRRHYLKVHFTH
jgi:hypothetical protein